MVVEGKTIFSYVVVVHSVVVGVDVVEVVVLNCFSTFCSSYKKILKINSSDILTHVNWNRHV